MTTLVDLMQREVPASIDLTGKAKGTVAVSFGRSSHLTPVIRFGGDRFGLHTSIVTANGIECEIAGLRFHRRPDGEWESDRYRNIRRHIDYADRSVSLADLDPPRKTQDVIIDACHAQCTRLYEQFPDSFTDLGTGGHHASGFGSVIQRLQQDIEIVTEWEALYQMVEEGAAVVNQRARTPRAGEQLPDEIRWDTPSRDTLTNSDIQKGRGPVVGAVVATGPYPTLLGYAVDTHGTKYQPDMYYGALLVPARYARPG